MLSEFFLGLGMSFVGSLPIGIISWVVIETTVHRNAKAGILAAFGVSVIEVLQAFVALACIGYFIQYPILKTIVLIASVPVFLFLGYKHITNDGTLKQKVQDNKNENPFLKGLIISSLNMVVIPYWLLWGGIFIDQHQLIPEWTHFAVFAVGAGLGAFLAMLLYVILGLLAHNKLQRYNKWVNRAIGVLFFALAGMLVWNIVKSFL